MAGHQAVERDKDDIDALGLGMLGCLRRAFDLLEDHKGVAVDMATVPPGD